MSEQTCVWVATEFEGKLMIAELVLTPAKYLAVDAGGGLISVIAGRRIPLGVFLGLAGGPDQLTDCLGDVRGREVIIVPATNQPQVLR